MYNVNSRTRYRGRSRVGDLEISMMDLGCNDAARRERASARGMHQVHHLRRRRACGLQRIWFILPPEAEWLLASPVGAAALLRFVGRPGVPRMGHGIVLGTPGRHPGRTPPTAALSLPIGSAGGGSAGGGGTRGGAGRARGNGWLCCPRRVPRSHSTEVLRRLLHLRGGAVGGRGDGDPRTRSWLARRPGRRHGRRTPTEQQQATPL